MLPTEIIWFFSVIAAIMLFLHGLAAFSDEVTRFGGERLKEILRKITRTDWRGAFVGATATAIIQSSSAVSSMAVGLAHNKTLTERGALAIIIGANVGTTLTAWLVAHKIEGLGPIFVSLGGLWSLMGIRPWRPYGKAVFYCGLIFLALDLIAETLHPQADSATIQLLHHWIQHPVVALLAGALLTALVQSSSVVSGLAVLAVSQQFISAQEAIWIVAGTNVGTTSTALIASSILDTVARKLALLNTLFNVMGVVIFATLLQPIIHAILNTTLPMVDQVALVHTTFNLTSAIIALMAMPILWPRIALWLHPVTRERKSI